MASGSERRYDYETKRLYTLARQSDPTIHDLNTSDIFKAHILEKIK
jgi:hypothetical protein